MGGRGETLARGEAPIPLLVFDVLMDMTTAIYIVKFTSVQLHFLRVLWYVARGVFRNSADF
jgi:hypothetical protein